MDEIQTIEDFVEYVHKITQKTEYTGELDQFLITLDHLIEENEVAEPTWQLFASLIARSLAIEPPQNEIDIQMFLEPPDLENTQGVESDLVILHNLIRYQIADYKRMRQAGILDDPYRYFGVTSPTGHSWNNFEVIDYWECATAIVRYAKPDENKVSDNSASWHDLAVFLWLGQIYE